MQRNPFRFFDLNNTESVELSRLMFMPDVEGLGIDLIKLPAQMVSTTLGLSLLTTVTGPATLAMAPMVILDALGPEKVTKVLSDYKKLLNQESEVKSSPSKKQ